MAAQEFTEELCDQLYKAPKYVASKISWKQRDGSSGVFIFQAKVLTEDGTALDLSGHWQKNGRHGRTVWGFSLKYQGHIVRQYCMAKRHRNPGGGSVRGNHKHKFSSSKIDRLAYKPNPPISDANANQALMDFLEEGNINRKFHYQDFNFFAL